MKSAYELAMERFQKESPTKSLTEEQKKELADIDVRYRAKIAEKKIFLESQIQASGGGAEEEAIRKQLASEIARLEQEKEEKKEALRNS